MYVWTIPVPILQFGCCVRRVALKLAGWSRGMLIYSVILVKHSWCHSSLKSVLCLRREGERTPVHPFIWIFLSVSHPASILCRADAWEISLTQCVCISLCCMPAVEEAGLPSYSRSVLSHAHATSLSLFFFFSLLFLSSHPVPVCFLSSVPPPCWFVCFCSLWRTNVLLRRHIVWATINLHSNDIHAFIPARM